MASEEGMTDLQFKSWLRGLVEDLEEVLEMETLEERHAKLDKMITRLKLDLQG